MENKLKNIFLSIMEQYPAARSTSVYPGDGKLKNVVEVDAVHKIQSFVSSRWENINWKVEGSVGKGRWATVPWIAILNTDITKTVSKGVYIVFLFSAIGDKVFLTLNQGTGGINKAQSGQVQNELREKYLSAIPKHNKITFHIGKLPKNALEGGGRLRPKAYEEACILWKEYKLSDLESLKDDSIFWNDVKELVSYYSIENNNQLKFNENILESNSLSKLEVFNYLSFQSDVKSSGFKFKERFILRFIASLCTKPLVILTGISGSGKTKLAQIFSKWICKDESQIIIIPVGSDWTNREPLLGFPNALEPAKYVKPDNGMIDFLNKALKSENSKKPYFLILDEMNLSHVERYFADFLSTMESGDKIALHNGSSEWYDDVPSSVSLPTNLFIIGTVNIDETTYMFSPKVLDRANVIEFRVSDDEMSEFLQNPVKPDLDKLTGAGASMAEDFVRIAGEEISEFEKKDEINKELIKFFNELKKTGSEFGYRTASEIYRFAGVLKKLTKDNATDWDTDDIIDAAVMQKLLPKVHGSRKKLEPVLKSLAELCLSPEIEKPDDALRELESLPEKIIESEKVRYRISLEKILRMKKRVVQDGFTSFAEA